jgi:hypothetical protein
MDRQVCGRLLALLDLAGANEDQQVQTKVALAVSLVLQARFEFVQLRDSNPQLTLPHMLPQQHFTGKCVWQGV